MEFKREATSHGHGKKCRLCSNFSEGCWMAMIKNVYFVLSTVKAVGSHRVSWSDLCYSKSLTAVCGE